MVDFTTTVIGVTLALIATICFNLAEVFQKKGFMEGLPEINIEEGILKVAKTFKEFFKNKFWITGFLLGIIGFFPYIISMGMIGIIATQPLMSLGLIIFVISASKMLNEKISFFGIIAIGMLGVAPILITLAGISEIRIDLLDLDSFVIPFVIFFIFMISVSVLFYLVSLKKKGTQSEGLFVALTGVFIYIISVIFLNIIAQAYIDANVQITWYFLIELGFGIFWFDYYHVWLFIACWGSLICNIISLVFIQSALQKSKAVVIVPILNSLAIIIPVIVGLFIFRQSFNNYYLFSIALGMILIANLVLSKYEAEIETIEIS